MSAGGRATTCRSELCSVKTNNRGTLSLPRRRHFSGLVRSKILSLNQDRLQVLIRLVCTAVTNFRSTSIKGQLFFCTPTYLPVHNQPSPSQRAPSTPSRIKPRLPHSQLSIDSPPDQLPSTSIAASLPCLPRFPPWPLCDRRLSTSTLRC